MDDLSRYFEPVRAVLREARWPGVEEGKSWGTVALKCGKKMICRLREPGVLVILCDFDEKERLMAAKPEIYYQIDHYSGYPAVLIRLLEIEPNELRERIEVVWRSVASPAMIAEFDSRL
jgi:hypothetical protein